MAQTLTVTRQVGDMVQEFRGDPGVIADFTAIVGMFEARGFQVQLPGEHGSIVLKSKSGPLANSAVVEYYGEKIDNQNQRIYLVKPNNP